MPGYKTIIKIVLAAFTFLTILFMPQPAGLSPEGQRVLAVTASAIVLWVTEAVHSSIVGLMAVVLLSVTLGVPSLKDGLYGFSQPLVYFLFGVYVMALAAAKSGLAESTARWMLARSRGNIRTLYVMLVASFALFSFLVPSATTRNSIQLPAYDEALRLAGYEKQNPAPKIVMLAMASLNRLGSTALLTGGIAPVTAAALLGNFTWGRWFMLMAVPYYILLILGGLFVYLMYRPRRGYVDCPDQQNGAKKVFSKNEIKTSIVMGVAMLLWSTESIHHLNSAVVALIGAVILMLPGIGFVRWREMESSLSWSSLFLVATALSLGQAFTTSGAAAWFAGRFISSTGLLGDSPYLQLFILMGVSGIVRLGIPEIAAVYSIMIPLAVVFAKQVGLNPLLCGLIVTIIPDAAIFYSAQSASCVIVYEKGWFEMADLIKVAVMMTILSFLLIFFIALPYWQLLGEPLIH